MLRTTCHFTGSLLRLILVMTLIAGVPLCSVAAQGGNADKSAPKPQKNEAPAQASGVLIPVGIGIGSTEVVAKPIAVTSATAINNPALEESNIAPVANKQPMSPLPIPAPGSAAAASSPEAGGVLPSAPAPVAAPSAASILSSLGSGFTESETDTTTATAATAAPGSVTNRLTADQSQLAPYMRDLKPAQIFDAGKGEDKTSMQRVAKLFGERKAARERFTLASIQNLSTYEYELEGPNEAKIRQEAQTRALLSAAGRVYFADCFLLGLDLLEPYLRENGKSFIARTTVLEHRTLSAERTTMRLRISVNLDALYKDLESKHFLAKPNVRPIVGVMMQEIVNGERNTTQGGRARIERTLEENTFQVFSDKMRQPALDSDVAGSTRLLKEARMEAQRNNIDVLISGTLVVQPVSQQQIYYDSFAFKEAEITLKMYRVDNGDVIGEARDRYSAAAGQDAEATKKVLDAMISRTAQRLADELNQMWPNTMLIQDNYRLMICGVDADSVTSIQNQLKTISPKLSVFQKSYLGNVLVINVVAPDVKPEKIETFLRESSEPQFNIKKIGKRQIILDVL